MKKNRVDTYQVFLSKETLQSSNNNYFFQKPLKDKQRNLGTIYNLKRNTSFFQKCRS